MEPSKRLEIVAARAGLLNLSIKELCAAVSASSATVYRWMRDADTAQIGRFGATLSALEAELDRREAAVVAAAAPRILDGLLPQATIDQLISRLQSALPASGLHERHDLSAQHPSFTGAGAHEGEGGGVHGSAAAVPSTEEAA